ncbi:F0F1 ATP synthase subunit epsilon [Pseudoroseicyclus tamaricis]|uniref:ATP synthase epsilon chain n=1 Tax=Pseudoroseicyclus tamaricis TaxID=2705421 RepID=A0A6B2JMP7_9RHOB|nr:F0F1 ATP synthase subunit epsilon [Pseudoroseicyclus tamaricis]NDU99926.1 F0F1 ATP synthase subunit epsilon [Pseudoroseicyclus tamaricis]
MADNVQFDLVSPERRLASLEASSVDIPGADGDMTAMADHAPTITTLRPGLLKVHHAGGTDEYLVSGGFAEITAKSVSVLAEMAAPRAEVDGDMLGRLRDEASARAEQVKGQDVEEAAAHKTLADLDALGRELNVSV